MEPIKRHVNQTLSINIAINVGLAKNLIQIRMMKGLKLKIHEEPLQSNKDSFIHPGVFPDETLTCVKQTFIRPTVLHLQSIIMHNKIKVEFPTWLNINPP